MDEEVRAIQRNISPGTNGNGIFILPVDLHNSSTDASQKSDTNQQWSNIPDSRRRSSDLSIHTNGMLSQGNANGLSPSTSRHNSLPPILQGSSKGYLQHVAPQHSSVAGSAKTIEMHDEKTNETLSIIRSSAQLHRRIVQHPSSGDVPLQSMQKNRVNTIESGRMSSFTASPQNPFPISQQNPSLALLSNDLRVGNEINPSSLHDLLASLGAGSSQLHSIASLRETMKSLLPPELHSTAEKVLLEEENKLLQMRGQIVQGTIPNIATVPHREDIASGSYHSYIASASASSEPSTTNMNPPQPFQLNTVPIAYSTYSTEIFEGIMTPSVPNTPIGPEFATFSHPIGPWGGEEIEPMAQHAPLSRITPSTTNVPLGGGRSLDLLTHSGSTNSSVAPNEHADSARSSQGDPMSYSTASERRSTSSHHVPNTCPSVGAKTYLQTNDEEYASQGKTAPPKNELPTVELKSLSDNMGRVDATFLTTMHSLDEETDSATSGKYADTQFPGDSIPSDPTKRIHKKTSIAMSLTTKPGLSGINDTSPENDRHLNLCQPNRTVVENPDESSAHSTNRQIQVAQEPTTEENQVKKPTRGRIQVSERARRAEQLFLSRTASKATDPVQVPDSNNEAVKVPPRASSLLARARSLSVGNGTNSTKVIKSSLEANVSSVSALRDSITIRSNAKTPSTGPGPRSYARSTSIDTPPTRGRRMSMTSIEKNASAIGPDKPRTVMRRSSIAHIHRKAEASLNDTSRDARYMDVSKEMKSSTQEATKTPRIRRHSSISGGNKTTKSPVNLEAQLISEELLQSLRASLKSGIETIREEKQSQNFSKSSTSDNARMAHNEYRGDNTSHNLMKVSTTSVQSSLKGKSFEDADNQMATSSPGQKDIVSLLAKSVAQVLASKQALASNSSNGRSIDSVTVPGGRKKTPKRSKSRRSIENKVIQLEIHNDTGKIISEATTQNLDASYALERKHRRKSITVNKRSKNGEVNQKQQPKAPQPQDIMGFVSSLRTEEQGVYTFYKEGNSTSEMLSPPFTLLPPPSRKSSIASPSRSSLEFRLGCSTGVPEPMTPPPLWRTLSSYDSDTHSKSNKEHDRVERLSENNPLHVALPAPFLAPVLSSISQTGDDVDDTLFQTTASYGMVPTDTASASRSSSAVTSWASLSVTSLSRGLQTPLAGNDADMNSSFSSQTRNRLGDSLLRTINLSAVRRSSFLKPSSVHGKDSSTTTSPTSHSKEPSGSQDDRRNESERALDASQIPGDMQCVRISDQSSSLSLDMDGNDLEHPFSPASESSAFSPLFTSTDELDQPTGYIISPFDFHLSPDPTPMPRSTREDMRKRANSTSDASEMDEKEYSIPEAEVSTELDPIRRITFSPAQDAILAQMNEATETAEKFGRPTTQKNDNGSVVVVTPASIREICAECCSTQSFGLCNVCSDPFCHDCFKKIHANGNRAKHTFLLYEAAVDDKRDVSTGGAAEYISERLSSKSPQAAAALPLHLDVQDSEVQGIVPEGSEEGRPAEDNKQPQSEAGHAIAYLTQSNERSSLLFSTKKLEQLVTATQKSFPAVPNSISTAEAIASEGSSAVIQPAASGNIRFAMSPDSQKRLTHLTKGPSAAVHSNAVDNMVERSGNELSNAEKHHFEFSRIVEQTKSIQEPLPTKIRSDPIALRKPVNPHALLNKISSICNK